MTPAIKTPDAYNAIIKILEANGFVKLPDGGVYRANSGCSFDFDTLNQYPSVMDFQLDWPYA